MPYGSARIRARLLIPLSLAILLLLAGIFTSVYLLQKNHDTNENLEKIAALGELLPSLLADKAGLMEALAPVLQEAPGLASAWQRRDRAELLQRAAPFLDTWRFRFGISHCYFIAPDHTCFLRVHQPDRFGDTIHRHTLAAAAANNQQEHGLELGPMGKLTLRVVTPWPMNGKPPSGFVELGIDVQTMTPALAKVMGADLFWAVDKTSLQEIRTGQGALPVASFPDQERFDHVILVAGSAKEIPAPLARLHQPAP